jgi:hypothetical protein
MVLQINRWILTLGIVSALFVTIQIARSAEVKPKYGPNAMLLSHSHEYMTGHPSPDFWAMIPYYVGQKDDASCSVASVTMLVNASRWNKKLTADDELATQEAILKKVQLDGWKGGEVSKLRGVILDELGPLAQASLKAYGIDSTFQTFHMDGKKAANLETLHQALVENEKNAGDFILINFVQGVYTGDADAGHIAPIAAYDAAKKQVLVFDPDRRWYEPYWVSEETLLAGMATTDPSVSKSRGFVWVKLKN